MTTLTAIVLILLMVLALFTIPLGIPGLWIMIGLLLIGVTMGEVAFTTLLLLAVLGLIAEIAEFFLVKRLNLRYGGSNRAFWGALAGGLIGVFIGLPIPILGSLIAGLLGTFGGAFLVTWWETRHTGQAGRVGWGVLLGRVFASLVKTAAGIVILAVGAGALLFR